MNTEREIKNVLSDRVDGDLGNIRDYEEAEIEAILGVNDEQDDAE